jgi:hypothetical protein
MHPHFTDGNQSDAAAWLVGGNEAAVQELHQVGERSFHQEVDEAVRPCQVCRCCGTDMFVGQTAEFTSFTPSQLLQNLGQVASCDCQRWGVQGRHLGGWFGRVKSLELRCERPGLVGWR